MKSLFSNSFFNFLSQILTFASATIMTIIWARYLGPITMGQYSFLVWLSTTIAFVSTLGFSNALARYIPTIVAAGKLVEAKNFISKIFFLEVKVSLVVMAIFMLVVSFANISNKLFYLIIALTIPIFILNHIIQGLIHGLQRYELLFKINLFVVIVNLTISLTILFLGKHILELLILNLFLALLTFSLSVYYLRDYFILKSPKISDSLYKEVLKYTASVFVIIFLDSILMEKSEVFFLKIFSPIEQVAFYSLGFNLVSKVMILIPGAITGVLMPRIASYFGSEDQQSIKTTYFNISRYLALVTLPIIFAGFVLIDLVVDTFLGKDYLLVATVVKILLISGGLSSIAGATSSVLYGIGKQNIILKLAFIAAAVNIILDLYLIPHFGAIGAALANATAQILAVFVGTYYIIYKQKVSFPLIPFLKISLSAFFSAVFIFGLKSLKSILAFPNFMQIAFLGLMFIACFIVCLFIMRFFIYKDLEMIKRLRFHQ